MFGIDITSVVLGLITMLGGCGWMMDRKKHKEEIESLKADIRQKDFELAQKYVNDWETYIAKPLLSEVSELRQEVKELRHALQSIDYCPHRDDCPVYAGGLQRESSGR